MSSDKVENVLVLQGGGSLGAFGCGVFKALAKKNIKLDIVAGTSIGGEQHHYEVKPGMARP